MRKVFFVRLAERCRLLEIDAARLVRVLDALHRLLLREVRRGTQATGDGLFARVGERVAVHELPVHAAPEDGGPIEGDDVQIIRGILRLEEVFRCFRTVGLGWSFVGAATVVEEARYVLLLELVRRVFLCGGRSHGCGA